MDKRTTAEIQGELDFMRGVVEHNALLDLAIMARHIATLAALKGTVAEDPVAEVAFDCIKRYAEELRRSLADLADGEIPEDFWDDETRDKCDELKSELERRANLSAEQSEKTQRAAMN